MSAYLWVALGSALGGVGRYGFGLLAARWWGESFPWGTIIINVVGSFVIGFFGALTTAGGAMPASANMRVFVMVGICGGFTTFSSFSLQTLVLARDGNWVGASGNVVLSVVLCLLFVTLGQVSADRIGLRRAATMSVPHRILAILDQPDTADPVLAAASSVADRLGGARIEVLHVRHDVMEGFMPTEEVMSVQRRQEIEGEAARISDELRRRFEAWQGDGEWREVTGETARVVAQEAANADLVIVGHGVGRHTAEARQVIHTALFVAGRASLLVPSAAPVGLGRHVAIAWKPGAPAERAVEAAMPLLRRAERVSVLMATDEGSSDSPEDLMATLARSGVPADVQLFRAGSDRIGDALIARAHEAGADLLVMGAYSHSRVAEFILGGATREVLASADLPVLMRH
jgi:CrcB protein